MISVANLREEQMDNAKINARNKFLKWYTIKRKKKKIIKTNRKKEKKEKENENKMAIDIWMRRGKKWKNKMECNNSHCDW